MIRTGWLIFGISLASGAAATLLAAGWLGSQRSTPMTSVVVAARDIEAGQMLDATAVQLASWPSSALPPGSLSEVGSLLGRVPRAPIVRGEPILAAKLAAEGARGGLAAVIAPGKRAMTVRVNEVVGVAGFALPGNHVDVLLGASDGGAGVQAMSRIVLERILVLAVAQEAGREDVRPRVVSAVTLEVTPRQAETLDLARAIGQLSLVLRNQVDPERGIGPGVTRGDLLETRPEPPPAAKHADRREPPDAGRLSTGAASAIAPPYEPPTIQIEVIRGVLKSTANWSAPEILNAQ